MGNRVSQYLRSNVLGLVAIFIALSGVSYAAQGGGGGGGTVKKNTVVSKSIKDGEVKTADLADDAVTSAKVADGSITDDDLAPGTGGGVSSVSAGPGLSVSGGSDVVVGIASGGVTSGLVQDDSLTGSDIDESTLGQVPTAGDSGTLDGIDSTGFVKLGSAAQTGGFSVTGDSRIQGELRQGSETGTSQGPLVFGSPSGTITRRIYSSTQTSGQVVATVGDMRIERDGTPGGLRIQYSFGGAQRSVACMGQTSGSNPANTYFNVPNQNSAFPIYTDAQNVVQAHCQFGNASSGGDTASVDLLRYPGSSTWVGFVTSTYNQ